jgi:hypothetical protein
MKIKIIMTTINNIEKVAWEHKREIPFNTNSITEIYKVFPKAI